MARPKKVERPLIVLSNAYITRVGRECMELWEMVDRASGKAVDPISQRDLAVVAERLAKLGEMFR